MRRRGARSSGHPIFVSLCIGAASALIFVSLYVMGVEALARFETVVKDTQLWMGGTRNTDPAIVFCDIDDDSLRTLGQFPVPRDCYTWFISRLGGAQMIGFDILLLEEGVPSKQKRDEAVSRATELMSALDEGMDEEGRVSQEAQKELGEIYQQLGEAIQGADIDLGEAVAAHGRVLFPIVFYETYSDTGEMESKDKEYKGIASAIQNEMFRAPELYEVWFTVSHYKVLSRLKEMFEAEGKRTIGGTPWDGVEKSADPIIRRVRAADNWFVLSRLEQLGMIIPRDELDESGITYADIFTRGYQRNQGVELDPPLTEAESRTLRFLEEPLPLYEENRSKLESMDLRERPFEQTHRRIFAEAFGGFLYANARDDIGGILRSQRPAFTRQLYGAVDSYIRHCLAEENAVPLEDLFIDAAGNPLTTEEEKLAAARSLRVVPDDFDIGGLPLVDLCAAVAAPTYISMDRDFDGSLRSYPLVTRRGPYAFFPMAIVMVCHHLKISLEDIRICAGRFVLLPGATYPDGRTDDIRIPTDRHARMMVNWAGPFDDHTLFKHYTFAEIADPELKNEAYIDQLTDKLVLVGLTAAGTHDQAPNPFQGNYPLVGAHANVINTILTQRFLHPDVGLSRYVNVLLICFLSILVALTTGTFSQHWSGIVLVGALAVYAVCAQVAYYTYGRPVNVVYTVLAVFVSFAGVLLYRYMTEEFQKKVVRAMFSTMVSPQVLRYMQESPDRFRLTGEKKMATIFFSDLAGFTTISESLTAQDLAEVLNEYLTPMSNIILQYGGYIDKYEGDAIMADFGVPVWEDEDEEDSHAWKCCWAAIEQYEELKRMRPNFKERFGIDIDARIGVNTGHVSAGNMGSEQKFQYTVMGDAVNQAARFEPANKMFDTRIIIGELTYQLSKSKIEARLLASLVVKGKTEPVKCYELLGKKGEVSEEKLELVALFEEAWRDHAAKDFETAIRRLDRCLEIDPDDGPSKTYRQVCVDYLREMPPADWRGEFIQTSK